MRLLNWLAKSGRGTTRRVAESCGVNPKSVGRIARGEYRPSIELAGKISAATGGQVTIEDLLGGLPEGAVWSPRVAELAQQVDELEMLFSADDLALLRGAKRPMASASAMAAATRGAA